MPVGTLAAPWAQVSGRFSGSPSLSPGDGSIVAMPQPNGQTNIRKYVVPNQPNSTVQLQMRAFMVSVSEAYQSLTIEQVQGWKDLAANIILSNRFDVSYTPSWNIIFSQVNNYRLQGGQPIILDAPAFSTTPLMQFIPGSEIQSDDGTPSQQLSFNLEWLVAADGVAGLPYRVRVSRPSSSPVLQIPVNELRMCNSDSTLNFGASVATPTMALTVLSNRLNINETNRVAVEALILTPDYIPSQQILLRNVEVQPV